MGIEGVLTFSIDRNTRLESGTVIVLPAGTLEIGSATHPIGPDVQAEIVIADWPLATSGPDDVTGVYDPRQFGTGLLGLGTITMHGAPRSPTFARLGVEPRSGHKTLILESAPAGWRPGDRVFVPDTRHLGQSGSPQYRGQWEERIIQSVYGNTVRLDRDLDHDHRGARDGEGALDFLPHVGNLGRNVIERSSNPAGTRGHVLFGDRARVDVRFVLFKDLGRTKEAPLDDTIVDAAGNAVHIGTNQRARYPLHLHHLRRLDTGTEADAHQFTLIGNAIDGGSESVDLKWGLVIHGSHFGLVQENVLYNAAAGAGVVTEDGSEYHNVIERNFVARVQSTRQKRASERDVRNGLGGDGYWFAGPMSIVRDNVASNVRKTGFVALGGTIHEEGGPVSHAADIPLFPGANTMKPDEVARVNLRHVSFVEFDGNEVYGATPTAVDVWDIGDRFGRRGDPNAEETLIRNLSAWHINNAAIAPYFATGVVVEGLVVRGDPKAMREDSENSSRQTAIQVSGSRNAKLTVRDADIQNMQYGIVQRGRGVFDHLLIEDSYFRAPRQNLWVQLVLRRSVHFVGEKERA